MRVIYTAARNEEDAEFQASTTAAFATKSQAIEHLDFMNRLVHQPDLYKLYEIRVTATELRGHNAKAKP